MNIPLSLPLDSDGFLSQECPACMQRFKARFGEGSDQPLSFCPYCGYEARDCWWTPEQAEYINATVQEKAVAPLLDDFGKTLEHLNRTGGALRVSVSRRPTPRAVPPAESEEPMAEQLFACCGERIKFQRTNGPLFCVICGVESTVEPAPPAEGF